MCRLAPQMQKIGFFAQRAPAHIHTKIENFWRIQIEIDHAAYEKNMQFDQFLLYFLKNLKMN